jgi:FkbM family methyltransferase
MSKNNYEKISIALNAIGKNVNTRNKITNLLIEIEAELKLQDKNARESIIGPIMDELYSNSGVLRKKIQDGLVFNFLYNSKIAREFLLSDVNIPDHVWEPQTTRLLKHFSRVCKNVIVGGAFFGDQAIIIANELRKNEGFCHAFEPNNRQCDMLRKNVIDNNLTNLIINQKALWNVSGLKIILDSSGMSDEGNWGAKDSIVVNSSDSMYVESISINDYLNQKNIKKIDLIMLDLEGGEFAALNGAIDYLNQPVESSPIVVFEVHSKYTDWSNGFDNVDIIKYLNDLGYKIFAIRDYHSNKNMNNTTIELIPTGSIYLDGPHHGFNVIAVKNIKLFDNDLFDFVKEVSPKYLDHKDPIIHQPLNINKK